MEMFNSENRKKQEKITELITFTLSAGFLCSLSYASMGDPVES